MGSILKHTTIALSFAFSSAAALAQETGAQAPSQSPQAAAPIKVEMTPPKSPDDPAEYEFRVKRVVRLTGPVNEASAVAVIQRLQYLDNNNPKGEDITLLINSGGGEITQGMLIYDTMRNLKSDVRTVCEGRAHSMGAVLLAAGTPGKRAALPHCRIMLHQASATNSGKLTDVVNQFAEFTEQNEIIMDLLSRHMNRNKADIKRSFQPDFYVDAVKAREFGVIDNVQGPLRAPLPLGTRPMPALTPAPAQQP